MSKLSVVDITKTLKGMEFPADKEDILDHARDGGADEDVLSMLEAMPDEEYGSVTDVMHAFGEINHRDSSKK